MTDDFLPNWLKKRAELTPNRPAIEFEGLIYSFADLDHLVEKMAGKLAAKGLKAVIRVQSYCEIILIVSYVYMLCFI